MNARFVVWFVLSCVSCSAAGDLDTDGEERVEELRHGRPLPSWPALMPVEEVSYSSVHAEPMPGGLLAPRSGPPNGDARFDVFLSKRGRFVVLGSAASNWVPGDANQSPDVFRVNRRTRRAERVSVGAYGEELTGTHFPVAVSDDACTVAFATIPNEGFSRTAALRVWSCETGHAQLIDASVTRQFRHLSETDRGIAALSANGEWLAYGNRLVNLATGARTDFPRSTLPTATFLSGDGRHVLFEDTDDPAGLKAYTSSNRSLQLVWGSTLDYDLSSFRRVQESSHRGLVLGFDASFWPSLGFDGIAHAFVADLIVGKVLHLSADPAVDWKSCLSSDPTGETSQGHFTRVSRDGTRAAFASCRAIQVVDLASRTLRRFEWPAIGYGPNAFDMSPDGDHLAVITSAALPGDTHPGTEPIPDFYEYPSGAGDYGRDVFVVELTPDP